jgi:hypothetical protein
MQLDTATLPSAFVTHASGTEMKRYLGANAGATAVIDFTSSTPVSFPSDAIPYFTSGGPSPGGALKPDILAIGHWLITADTTFENSNSPYLIQAGTSFSAPLVTGAAAALMSARPGLTSAQYKSLLVGSAPPLNWPLGGVVPPQIAGTGKLDLFRAIRSTAAAVPSSLNFQTATGTFDVTRTLVVSNVGAEADTFTVVAKPLKADSPVPEIDTAAFPLDKGASRQVQVRLAATDPAPGEYDGFLEIAGTKTEVVTRVPYWLGVRGSTVRFIALQRPVDLTTRSLGDEVQLLFRTLDITGLPIAVEPPEVTTTAVRGFVGDVVSAGNIPGTYQVTVRVGRAGTDGTNVFTIKAGDVSRDVTFFVRAAP